MKKLQMLLCAFAACTAMAELVEYRDYDANTGTFTNAVRECALVTGATRTLESGWYAVQGTVTIPADANLTVNGTAHLILCDGAKLTILNPGDHRNAVYVSKAASLIIYGQTAGTGALTVTGGNFSAGIGGGTTRVAVYSRDCGTVTVNGGTVTAQGGFEGAGIGGGYFGAGGTVIVNGGTVTATGGAYSAGIGGGCCGADGGTVTINGGTVVAQGNHDGAGIGGGQQGSGGIVTINGGTVMATGGVYGAGIGGGFAYGTHVAGGTVTVNGGTVMARGGQYGAGIGGGYNGAGGAVTINGGMVTAASEKAGDFGPGWDGSGGTVTIFGGVFARSIKDEWTAEGYAIGGNSDSATSSAYPYAVMSAAFTVTISDHPHSTVGWTYGNGTVTNLVTATSFKLGTGLKGVRVVFTPEHGYRFAVEEETGVRTLPSPVTEDCAVEAPTVEEIPCEVTFAVGAGIRRAAYVCGGVTNELVTEETALVVQLGTRVELIVEELPRYYPFAGARTFTVEQETMRVEIFASPIPKGMEGNPFQIGADVFASTNAAGVMTITGTGAMSNFVSATDVPWVPATVTAVTVDAGVTQIGANAWSGMADSVALNGTPLSTVRYLAPGVGSADPAGAISPAEFERIDIIDGKALLDVSVYTSDALTNENWSVATNGVIEVPAPGKQGFFILKSKPAW